MTTQTETEALKLALKDLKWIDNWIYEKPAPECIARLRKAIDSIKEALAHPEQSVAGYCKKIEELIVERDNLREALAQQKSQSNYCLQCEALSCELAAWKAQQSDEQVEPVAKKWLLHGSFADVASFDTEGFPSFYSKESFTKFKNGELSAPCKGKNCGSFNGWLHSAECRAEHESHYTHPPVPTAQPKEPEQDPVAIPRFGLNPDNGMMYESNRGPWCLYKDTTPPQRKPLTDAQINAIWDGLIASPDYSRAMIVRAIEAAHGIKE